MKAVRILLIVLICLILLGTTFLGLVFVMGSGFIFAGDIDLTEEQRKSAEIKVIFGSLFGLVLMLGSPVVMLASGVISNKILNLFGVKFDKE